MKHQGNIEGESISGERIHVVAPVKAVNFEVECINRE